MKSQPQNHGLNSGIILKTFTHVIVWLFPNAGMDDRTLKWRNQRGPRGFTWTPSPPTFLHILWKWNNLVSLRPNYFVSWNIFKELRYNQQSESQHVYTSEPHFQKSWILWRIQRGFRGFAWTPSPPIFLHILWKWNYLVSLRPNYFVFMGYFQRIKANPNTFIHLNPISRNPGSSGGSRGGSVGSPEPPPHQYFYISYENEIIWSHWDQIISFSWDIFKELKWEIISKANPHTFNKKS